MKIAIATVRVPFISGGAEIMTEMLCDELRKRGHKAEVFSFPFKWYPDQTLVDCMMMGRMMDLTEVNGTQIDTVIATKFPAFYTCHKNKVLWLMHQHRQVYDLWGTEHSGMEHMADKERVRALIHHSDTAYIQEAKRTFTISQNTADRLKQFNSLPSEALYHPPLHWEKMHYKSTGDFIFYPSRINQLKRQRILVEAMRYTKTNVRAVLAGSADGDELEYIRRLIQQYGLQEKVTLAGFISEEEKISYYANCLAVYFGAYDEDYGYITLEGMYSKKPVIVHPDAGGPLEFVNDEQNGYVINADAQAVAEKIDFLYENPKVATQMGAQGHESLQQKNISWDYVIDRLLNG